MLKIAFSFVLFVVVTVPIAVGDARTLASPDTSDPQLKQDAEELRAWSYRGDYRLPDELVSRLEARVASRPDDARSRYFLSQALQKRAELETFDGRSARAMQLLTEAAQMGDPAAQARLGMYLVTGRGVAKDRRRGVELIRGALEKDEPEAHLYMGIILSTPGLSPEKVDGPAAVQHLTKAVGTGVHRAWMYLFGVHAAANRQAEAIRCLRAGAEAGDPQAQAVLSNYYANGTLVPKDLEQAEKWARLAAETGSPQYVRGLADVIAAKGTKDAEQNALKLFREAAEKGEPKAQFQVAVATLSGAERETDVTIAVETLKKLSARGVADAQYTLGKLYCEGLLVERDLATAKSLFDQAAGAGHQGARTYQKWLTMARRTEQGAGPGER